MMPKKTTDYASLSAELDELLAKLQSENLDVDEAVELYERGMSIAKELEVYITNAENRVSKIKTDFSS